MHYSAEILSNTFFYWEQTFPEILSKMFHYSAKMLNLCWIAQKVCSVLQAGLNHSCVLYFRQERKIDLHQIDRIGQPNNKEIKEPILSEQIFARPTILTDMALKKILCALKATETTGEWAGKTLIKTMKLEDTNNISLETWGSHPETVSDMCYVTWNEMELLIMVNGWIKAYDPKEEQIIWTVCGKVGGSRKDINATSVTTDGAGHIFVVDGATQNVLMFVPDGTYIRVFIKNGCYGVMRPQLLSWWREENALALCHEVKAGKDAWGIPRFKKYVSIFKMSVSPDEKASKQRRNSWRFSW